MSAVGRDQLAAEKAALREAMRAIREAIPPSRRDGRARAAAELALELEGVREARTVLVFRSTGTEIDTEPLIDGLAARSNLVLLPVVEETLLRAAPYRPGDELVVAAFGIREPTARPFVHPGEIDAVVAPGLAFDREGYRLGYGGGFYDRLLAGLRPEAFRAGFGFHEQVVDRVPHGPGDERVQAVVTDRAVVPCAPGGV
ncbi:MAG: 5-formyltetrahydrofolate cyclo-ligase [Actinobacteria bacterium]|nr:5-formyltetrahydrofolate cyclo-ligase [Actinomycetota bacterium]